MKLFSNECLEIILDLDIEMLCAVICLPGDICVCILHHFD
jgi:hypothetical protein